MAIRLTVTLSVLAFLGAPAFPADELPTVQGEVTFSKDIAPILQRSCQNCHQPNSVAPMSLISYKDVRPWAKSIKQRTLLRDRPGVMPPWYIEKNVGIQHYKNDPSLSDLELAKIAKWADTGAPEGNPADLPPPRPLLDGTKWTLGEPDLVISTPEVTVKAGSPDWWGGLDPSPTGITEDRWVKSVEIREANDVPSGSDGGRKTIAGRYVFHHMIWTTSVPGQQAGLGDDVGEGSGDWPIHEPGRNADVFPDDAGKLLKAGSSVVFASTHLHSNGRDTKARLLFGFKFFPKTYKPTMRYVSRELGNGVDIDIRAGETNQRLDAYNVLEAHTKIKSFEPHLHAPGIRMCLEAIWGINIQTLTCAGYDHNWVRVYEYEDDYAPLLPKGTILHIIGYMDNTAANRNVTDPRNWSGAGNRSIANMFIDLGQSIAMTDGQFYAEMKKRRERLKLTPNDVVIGCPLCNDDPIAPPRKRTPAETGGTQ
ncbi:MAG: heme-binding domain-containing protein [Acidobacteriia bacterium]|nr:heme-binding domain-containing protein [Terriglobia bacterium]